MVPMIVAIVAAVASVTGAVIGSMKQTDQPTHAAPTGSAANPLAPNPTVETDARKSSARGFTVNVRDLETSRSCH